MKSITGLGSGFVLPRFGTYHYEKEAGKKKEEINYWVSNLSKVVSTDIDRVLNTSENKHVNLTFGYPSKVRDGRSGVDIVSGSDHGAGASRFVSKLNLSSPEDRKLNSNPSLNCRQVSFGLIDCKKDAAEILDIVSDDVNKGMKELVDGKLVGFKDMFNNTRSAIIPRGSTNIQVISPK